MKQHFTLTIAMAVALSTALFSNAQANASTVNTKVFLGEKTFDSNAWSTQDDHGSFGLITDFHTGFHGVRIALDVFASGSEENTSSQVKGTYTAEAHLGMRKYFDLKSKFEPYIGGGINLAFASQENNDGSGKTENEDTDNGVWLNGGLDFLISDHFTAGVDLRYSNAEVELYSQSLELKAFTAGVSLGYRW